MSNRISRDKDYYQKSHQDIVGYSTGTQYMFISQKMSHNSVLGITCGVSDNSGYNFGANSQMTTLQIVPPTTKKSLGRTPR